jgi:hypothetical protein
MEAHVTPLQIPNEHEYLEVAVILGPKAQTTGFPREKDGGTKLPLEDTLGDGRRVWIVYCTRSIQKLALNMDQTFSGKGHFASSFDPLVEQGELRGVGIDVRNDGSLAFWDVRAEAKHRV